MHVMSRMVNWVSSDKFCLPMCMRAGSVLLTKQPGLHARAVQSTHDYGMPTQSVLAAPPMHHHTGDQPL